jgi:hypothetical protein
MRFPGNAGSHGAPGENPGMIGVATRIDPPVFTGGFLEAAHGAPGENPGMIGVATRIDPPVFTGGFLGNGPQQPRTAI